MGGDFVEGVWTGIIRLRFVKSFGNLWCSMLIVMRYSARVPLEVCFFGASYEHLILNA